MQGAAPAPFRIYPVPMAIADAGTGNYQRLNARSVQATVERLYDRIVARFPTRHLGDVAMELSSLVALVEQSAGATRRRKRAIRNAANVGIAIIVAVTLLAIVLAIRDALTSGGVLRAYDWLPLVESAVSDLVFAGVAVFFLVTLPTRHERSVLLRLLHRLRSLAHVIDMHQLTKDPERLRPTFRPTEASVGMNLTAAELGNYLDYCSELLSLVGKAAALCAEENADPVVLDTVSTLETLTTGMSRKIWQKISLLPQP